MTPLIIVGVCAAIVTASAMNLLVESDPESRTQQIKRVITKQRINLPLAIIITCISAITLNVAYGVMSGSTPMLPVAGAIILAIQSSSLREENKFDPLLFITLILSPRLPDPERRARAARPRNTQTRGVTFSFQRPAFGSPRRTQLRGEDQIRMPERDTQD